MITNKKKFYQGFIGLAIFIALLSVMFMPLFGGDTAFVWADDLFNRIAKDSSYTVPSLLVESEKWDGTQLTTSATMNDAEQAQQTAAMYTMAGAQTTVSDKKVTINGDLGTITQAALTDSSIMYKNNETELSDKYGYNDMQVMYNWWLSFDKIRKNLDTQGLSSERNFVQKVQQKAIEPAYNFEGIEPKSAASSTGILVAAMVFYVFYTLLYGFSLMFIFEGLGFASKH
jgi:hypothetical protein